MKNLDNKINNILGGLDFLAPWLIRLVLGVSFILYGYQKFPLPPQALMEYFGFSPFLASFVAISEVVAGLLLLVGGLIKNHLGSIITRLSSFMIVTIMIFVFYIGHQDWFITVELFKNVQIFMFGSGFYFMIKGNN